MVDDRRKGSSVLFPFSVDEDTGPVSAAGVGAVVSKGSSLLRTVIFGSWSDSRTPHFSGRAPLPQLSPVTTAQLGDGEQWAPHNPGRKMIGRRSTCSFVAGNVRLQSATYVAERSVSLVRPAWPPVLERRCSSWPVLLVSPASQGSLSQLARIPSSETTAKVLELDDGRGLELRPQEEEAAASLVCGREETRKASGPVPSERVPRLLSSKGRNRRRPSCLDVLAPVGEGGTLCSSWLVSMFSAFPCATSKRLSRSNPQNLFFRDLSLRSPIAEPS
ncbi:hypothetical protein GWK47_025382 [Chionoecetes opilio]|uniref:Uncharacterized protein n=1 Tax=Chionoecetes opilio TaxID=41210 RepID=A0A8J8WN51_CHIOP|nr:hypothetical protein GWK47_025382 [Chionoecetes opilio]